jgi:DsbC/DsbD-like thiol-disulfide interchange protein
MYFKKEFVMTRHRHYRGAAVGLALLGLGLVLALGNGSALAAKKSDSVIKVSARAAKPDSDGKQTVTVTLAIEKGWHAYANPVQNKDLEAVQTTLTVGGKKKPKSVKISYPKGKEIIDKTLGNYRVYEDKAVIKAVVKRAKGDKGPLQLSVRIQACNSNSCLPPATVKLTVK